MSGSIAAFKVVQLVSRLVQAPVGAEVEVVMTPAARAFIGEASLEGLTGRRVRSETFAAGDYMEHIRLARWADVVLAAPCTANTLNKLSRGIGDDLVCTLFLAHDFTKPWLIAPAMNTRMYEHPTTRESLERLRAMGCTIVEAGNGALACGEIGAGRLAEPEVLLDAVLHAVGRRPEAPSVAAAPPPRHPPCGDAAPRRPQDIGDGGRHAHAPRCGALDRQRLHGPHGRRPRHGPRRARPCGDAAHRRGRTLRGGHHAPRTL
jgi:phosphopantothenoylcysteine decarboxylase/phosphopantothenate--cysteine ligase